MDRAAFLTPGQDLVIRPAGPDDLAGMARVMVDTWRAVYRGILPDDLLDGLSYPDQEEGHRRLLTRPGGVHFVVVEAFTGEVVGFANGGHARHSSLIAPGEIYELYVQQGFQRLGLGRRLFEAARTCFIERGRTALLVWVLADNPARTFYEKMGGRLFLEQTTRIGGAPVRQTAYVWEVLGGG